LDGPLDDVTQKDRIFDLCLYHLPVLHVEDNCRGYPDRQNDSECDNGYNFGFYYHKKDMFIVANKMPKKLISLSKNKSFF
jgi:hypothetical protein